MSTEDSSGSGSGSTDDPSSSAETSTGGPLFDVGVASESGSDVECTPTDVLVVLDRSQSMHRAPDGTQPEASPAGYQTSRWALALTALDGFWAQYEGGMALGLHLFPALADGCVTLAERIGGTSAINEVCETSELVFAPALNSAAMFEAALDPLTTLLCAHTPIAVALGDARVVLEGLPSSANQPHVVLLTDGAESCGGDVVGAIQQLVASTDGRVHIVAFGASSYTADHEQLNDMACAGRTATGFPGPCLDDGAGNYRAADPAGPALYLPAADGDALVAAFSDIADPLCCGTSCPAG